MRFKNPSNDYVEDGTTAISWLWAFLWPPLYYGVKGVWTHAFVSFILGWGVGMFTVGIGTVVTGLIYAVMNGSIVRKHYLSKGWVEA